MGKDKLKLPRTSYDVLCRIVRGYAQSGEPASLDEVAQVSAVNKFVISSNAAFLTHIGILEAGKLKRATDLGRRLGQALEHNLPDPIRAAWLEVVRGNDFLSKMATAVKIRGEMEAGALEAHIAYSAGEAKKPQVMAGARAVVEILVASGLVTQDADRILPASQRAAVEAVATPTAGTAEPPLGAPSVVAAPQLPGLPGVQLLIEVRVDAKPSELGGLGPKLRQLISEIRAEPSAEAE